MRRRAYFIVYEKELGSRVIRGRLVHAKKRYLCYLCDKTIDIGELYIYRRRNPLIGRGALYFCLNHVLDIRPIKTNRWLSKRVFQREEGGFWLNY